MVCFQVHLSFHWVPSITSMILWEHEQDPIIGDSSVFQVLVENQNIAGVPIVKVKFGGAQQDVEIVFVLQVELWVLLSEHQKKTAGKGYNKIHI